ncbi:hypothetical protein GCM10022205_46840 [Spinactinospora alkalitolerans]
MSSSPSEMADYEEENSGIPLTIRSAHDGSCVPYLAVDFDGSPSGGEFPITRRVGDEDDLTTAQLEAIDMRYVTCADGFLKVADGASVGLLRKGEEDGWRKCAAAASGASIGGSLEITDDARPADVGFEVGASLCAVTAEGRIARATITNIVYNAGYGDSLATVEFELATWKRK